MFVTLVAPVVGMLVVVGLIAIVMGSRPGPVRRRPAATALSWSQRWARLTRRPPGAAGRRQDMLLLLGLLIGIVGFLLTRWVAVIVLVPIAMVILPKLLGQAAPTDLPMLTALDRWVRTISATLSGGSDVIDTIRRNQASTPPLIADEVNALVDRFNTGWPAGAAFHRFADDLDSPEADAVVASLAMAANHSTGVTDNLQAIAESIQDRIKALRAVETERARPRQTARMVTVITLVMILAAAVLGGGYFDALANPLGQLIVAGLTTGYVGSLLIMYRSTVPRRRERIYTTPTEVI